MPVYNGAKYLRVTLDSILRQTFSDFELILINDGSTDETAKIIDEYEMKDKRIRCFHKENEGVSSARNYGLDKANGKYISFLDSDDIMYEDNLEVMFREIGDNELLICNYAQQSRERIDKVKLRVEAAGKEQLAHKILDIDVWYNALCWNKLYLHTFLEENHLRFRNVDFYAQTEEEIIKHQLKKGNKAIECEDELWSYEVFNKVERVKRIDYMGIWYNHNPGSRGCSHRAIPEIDWLLTMDNIYSEQYNRLQLENESYNSVC